MLVRISPHLDLDHPDESKRKMHKFLFKQEIEYAQYLGVYGVILPLPKEDTYAFYLKTMTKVSWMPHLLSPGFRFSPPH